MQDRLPNSTTFSCNARPDHTFGSNASVELSWHVGFTSDSGRIAARQRTDASGLARDIDAPSTRIGGSCTFFKSYLAALQGAL